MAKIHGLMDMGKRGMMLSQTALQTTSHNIANKSTEGYSRQRADMVTNPATDEGRYRLGTGARLGGISRTNNPWLEKQIEKEGANLAFLDGKSNALARLEGAVNEATVQGLNASVSDFFNSFRELANNPESAIPRTQVRETAQTMIKNFQDAKRQIDGVNTDLNKNVEFSVNEVNSMAKQIANLNEKIMTIEVAGANANDERDSRDLLVKKLSEKLDISYAEDSKTGMLNITAGKTSVLVAGTSTGSIKSYLDENDQVKIINELSPGGADFDITEQFKNGAVGGALDLKNGILTDLASNLDELAYGIASEVNRAHQEGFDRYNQMGSQFFTIPADGTFNVDNMSLSKDIQSDVGRIAASAKPNAPGDNTAANVIHSLQFKPFMGEGKYSFGDFYNSKVAELGMITAGNKTALEAQQGSVGQLKNIRESISGVSVDEEAAKMIEFQKSFEASARMIRVADEMFDTVLNLKRM